MKKQVIYMISTILLLTVAVIGSTYAFFLSTTGNNNNSVTTGASNFEVIYRGDTEISGVMPVTYEKTDDFKRTVSIKVAEDSVEAYANIYINIEHMTNNLSIDGFIWEVYGYQNGNLVYSDSESFKNYNDTTNNKVDIVSNYKVTKTNTTFDIYLWIDGEQVNNDVLGASFSGHIGANTEYFTGQLS